MEDRLTQLEELWPCFQGIIPAALSTCSEDGTPNITFISQIHYVDPTHVAISHQFFNKTHRNVRENPLACAMMLDPRTLQAHRIYLRYQHSESSGPLFDSMSLQLQAIASHAGMTDHSLRYACAVRDRAEAGGGADAVCREIPLPGLPSAAGQIAVPLLTRGRLIGVLAVESAEPLAFMSREDTLLTIVASHLGGVHRTTQPGYGRISTRRPRKTSVFARARRTTAEPQLLFLPPG